MSGKKELEVRRFRDIAFELSSRRGLRKAVVRFSLFPSLLPLSFPSVHQPLFFSLVSPRSPGHRSRPRLPLSNPLPHHLLLSNPTLLSRFVPPTPRHRRLLNPNPRLPNFRLQTLLLTFSHHLPRPEDRGRSFRFQGDRNLVGSQRGGRGIDHWVACLWEVDGRYDWDVSEEREVERVGGCWV